MQYKSDDELIFEQYNKILFKENYGVDSYDAAINEGVFDGFNTMEKIWDRIYKASAIGSAETIWDNICKTAAAVGSVIKGVTIATGIIGAAYSLFHIGTWVYDLYKAYKRSKSFKELTYKMYGKSKEIDNLLDNLNNLQISDTEKLDMVGKMIQQRDAIPTKRETIQKIVEDNYKKYYSDIIL